MLVLDHVSVYGSPPHAALPSSDPRNWRRRIVAGTVGGSIDLYFGSLVWVQYETTIMEWTRADWLRRSMRAAMCYDSMSCMKASIRARHKST
jgi:hypothetical protein